MAHHEVEVRAVRFIVPNFPVLVEHTCYTELRELHTHCFILSKQFSIGACSTDGRRLQGLQLVG